MSRKRIENYSFNQWEGQPGVELYDGEGNTVKNAGGIVSIDIEITNDALVPLYVELFAGGVSFTKAERTEWVSGNYTYLPADAIRAAFTDDGIVGFDENGNLLITGAEGAGRLTVSCSQIPYRQLLEKTATQAFRIERTRMTVTTDAQISKQITCFAKSFLGGTASNNLNPRRFFSPDQQQSLIIDIPVPFRVDAERGMYLQVLAGETIQFNMDISQYTETTV